MRGRILRHEINVLRTAEDIAAPDKEERGPFQNEAVGNSRCPESVKEAFSNVALKNRVQFFSRLPELPKTGVHRQSGQQADDRIRDLSAGRRDVAEAGEVDIQAPVEAPPLALHDSRVLKLAQPVIVDPGFLRIPRTELGSEP